MARKRKTPTQEIQAVWDEWFFHHCHAARDKLFETYLPIAQRIAGKMNSRTPSTVDYDDLLAWGGLGLLKAIENYDPSKNTSFEPYAIQLIRGSMLDELRAMDWLPRSLRRKHKDVERASAHLEGNIGREPTSHEIAEHLDIAPREVTHIQHTGDRGWFRSLDEVNPIQDDLSENYEVLSFDNHTEDPQDVATHLSSQDALVEALSKRNLRTQVVCALIMYEGFSHTQAAAILGIHPQEALLDYHQALISIHAHLAAHLEEPISL